jgi:molecular chaperone Hsp33
VKKDICYVTTAYNGEVRVIIVDAINTVRKALLIHNVKKEHKSFFGEFILASLIMGETFKQHESVYLKLASNIGEMVASSDNKGNVKADIEVNDENTIKSGTLNVIRQLDDKSIYNSTIEINSDNISDIFTSYYLTSDQTLTCIKTSCTFKSEGILDHAFGFMLQLLPAASVETKKNINKVFDYEDLFSKDIEHILSLLTGSSHTLVFEQNLKYFCDCTKEKYYTKLIALDKKTIDSIIKDNTDVEIVCPFCHKKYVFNKKELEEIYKTK